MLEMVGNYLLPSGPGRWDYISMNPSGATLVLAHLGAKHFYRPVDRTAYAKYASQFPAAKTFTVQEVFGDWELVQKTHLADNALFDQIYQPSTK